MKTLTKQEQKDEAYEAYRAINDPALKAYRAIRDAAFKAYQTKLEEINAHNERLKK